MQFPVFPLNGAVLFPGTNLPLNIFEPRYIQMVDYALLNNRLIGMIQKKENDNLFDIGCLGKITNFSEKYDGRYEINLEGLYCFKIIKVDKNNHSFITVNAEPIIAEKNINGTLLKNKILSSYQKYLNYKQIKLNLSQFNDLDTINLSKIICILSPFDFLVKQMLLEENNEKEFCEKLISVLEIETQDNQKNIKLN